MSLKRCPRCAGRLSPEDAFAEGPVRCGGCGMLLFPRPPLVLPPEGRARWEETHRLRRFQRKADRVCQLILRRDVPRAEVADARESLRAECERLFPGRLDLYDMIYESRFERLWQQFREAEEG